MKYCPMCGNEIESDARYCPKCGCLIGNEEVVNENKTYSDETGSFWKSLIDFFNLVKEVMREAKFQFTNVIDESVNEVPNKPSDAKCPYCDCEDTYLVVKNEVQVKQRGYDWGSGCCGMCLLGPFGLLCGLCGSESEVNSKSRSWWGCKNCGRHHLAQHDAVEMISSFVDVLSVSCFGYGAIGSILIYLILDQFIHGFLQTILVLLIAAVLAVSVPLYLVYRFFEKMKEQLGYEAWEILEPENKKKYWNSIKISMACLGGTLVLVYPILMSFLE